MWRTSDSILKDGDDAGRKRSLSNNIDRIVYISPVNQYKQLDKYIPGPSQATTKLLVMEDGVSSEKNGSRAHPAASPKGRR